ncbi:hypothetical protein D3C75_772100 [compost metagenome]
MIAWVRLGKAGEFAACFPVKLASVYDDSANRGAMAADKFGSRMHHDIRSVLNRAQQIRTREGIVDNQRNSVLMGDGCYCFDIQYVTLRVADRFGIERLRFISNCCPEILRMIRIHKIHFDSKLRQGGREQIISPAVEAGRRYYFIACTGNIQHREGNRRRP